MKIQFEQGSAKKEIKKFFKDTWFSLLVLSVPVIFIILFYIAVYNAGVAR